MTGSGKPDHVPRRSPGGDDETVIVRANWFILSLWWIGPSLAIGSLWAWYQGATQGIPVDRTEVGVLAGIGVALVAFILLVFTAFVRRVELDSRSVVFVRGVTQRRAAWGELLPPKYPYAIGLQFGVPNGDRPADTLWFAVSRAQARAILSCPSCPEFHLNAKILKSIGLPG